MSGIGLFRQRARGAVLLLLTVAVFAACQGASDKSGSSASTATGDTDPVPETAVGTSGMISSAHPEATEAGLRILEAGGNAYDAAVAVATALNVVEPMMSGIGGYGTILVYDAETGRSRFLNSSGRIPQGLDSDVFRPPTPN